MIKKVDPLTRIKILFGYCKGLKLSGDWIKDKMSITREMTTKLQEITDKKMSKNDK